MRLKNLTQVLIYKPERENINGEYNTKWIYKGTAYLNKQQDLNELDRNSSGEIDYEIIKLHTDKIYNIKKGYGISFTTTDGIKKDNELVLYEENNIMLEDIETDDIPDYIVSSCPKIGKSMIYTCKTNNEE